MSTKAKKSSKAKKPARRKKAIAPRVVESKYARGKRDTRTAGERKSVARLVKGYIKELRAVYRGYEAKDGYSLQEPFALHPSRLKKVIREAQNLREITNRPHVLVKPTKKDEAKQLAKVTGLRSKKVKTYPVHVDDPKRSKVKFVKGKVEIRTRLKSGHVIADRYFWFPDEPSSWDDIEEMTREMLPEMPPGYYVVVNTQHGDIGMGAHRNVLLRMMQRWAVEYDDPSKVGFDRSILGYRYIAETAKAHDEYLRARRTARERFADRMYDERQARTAAGKLPCPLCEAQFTTRKQLDAHKRREHRLTKRARMKGRR